MVAVHRSLAIALVAIAALFTVAATAAAYSSGSRPWLEWLRRTVTGAVVVEVLGGALLFGTGHRPQESLHLLYGVAAAVVLPFGSLFAVEAPSRPRAGVLAAAGLLTVGILFRSFVTG
jgi:type IV secretory pathway VirB2 component (pilin)